MGLGKGQGNIMAAEGRVRGQNCVDIPDECLAIKEIPRMSEKEREYVNDVLDRQFDTTKNSKYNTALEAAFAERFKMPFGIGMVNGTCTMHTALVCEGIGAGDEVICPALTMSATSLCILQAGTSSVISGGRKGEISSMLRGSSATWRITGSWR